MTPNYIKIATDLIESKKIEYSNDTGYYVNNEVRTVYFAIIDAQNHFRYSTQHNILLDESAKTRLVIIQKEFYHNGWPQHSWHFTFTINDYGDIHNAFYFCNWKVDLFENSAFRNQTEFKFKNVNEDRSIQCQHILDTLQLMKDLSTKEQIDEFRDNYNKTQTAEELLASTSSKDEQIKLLKEKIEEYEKTLQTLKQLLK